MKRLILVRHAKSDWSGPNQADHERPLNLRGRITSPLMGAWIAEKADEGGWSIDGVLSSTSVRTRETWDRLSLLLDRPPAPIFESALYLAEPEDMLAAVQSAPEPPKNNMIHAPNPALKKIQIRKPQ
ncbi:MAG: histidine phosphatase family protein, partial [Neomegalonema sp.]